jgi:hypothetical protein
MLPRSFTRPGTAVPRRDGVKEPLGSDAGKAESPVMRHALPLAVLAFVVSPALAAAPDRVLVANEDGSVTLTETIDSAPPVLLLEPAPRPGRNAARVRARAEAETELDRAFQEAVAQARETARVPRPH